jgi:hypothetical protein
MRCEGRGARGSSAEQIAEIVYEAATDQQHYLTYVEEVDVKETYAGSGASRGIGVQRTLFASTPLLCQSDGPF